MALVILLLFTITHGILSHDVDEHAADPHTTDLSADIADLLLPLLGSEHTDPTLDQAHENKKLIELRRKLKKNPLAIILAKPEDARKMDKENNKVIFLNDLHKTGDRQPAPEESSSAAEAVQGRSGLLDTDLPDGRRRLTDAEALELHQPNTLTMRSSSHGNEYLQNRNGAIFDMNQYGQDPSSYQRIFSDAYKNQFYNYNSGLSPNFNYGARTTDEDSLQTLRDIIRDRAPKIIQDRPQDTLDFSDSKSKRLRDSISAVDSAEERADGKSNDNVLKDIVLTKKQPSERVGLDDADTLHKKYYFSFNLSK